jgi:hypothetical protein
MNDCQRILLGFLGTATTAGLETSTEHPATIAAAAATAAFMAVSTYYKIKNNGK